MIISLLFPQSIPMVFFLKTHAPVEANLNLIAFYF